MRRMTMEKPGSLKKGDHIALISTARKISLEELDAAIGIFEGWGLVVELGEHLFATEHQFAGGTANRAADLQWALDNENIKAVVCARGGYGTVKVIDAIDFSSFIKSPKWIVGYSDVTVLHNHVNENFNIQTLHATMPINFMSNTIESLDSLKAALFGVDLVHHFNRNQFNRSGIGKGVLLGGNLSIIYSLTGTSSQINTDGKILFLEDLDEYLYHVDRMMVNLKRIGLLNNLAGLIVGGMSDMNDNAIPFGSSVEQIILEAVAEFDYPVCFSFPAGHVADNRALILGDVVELVVAEKCSLTFSS